MRKLLEAVNGFAHRAAATLSKSDHSAAAQPPQSQDGGAEAGPAPTARTPPEGPRHRGWIGEHGRIIAVAVAVLMIPVVVAVAAVRSDGADDAVAPPTPPATAPPTEPRDPEIARFVLTGTETG